MIYVGNGEVVLVVECCIVEVVINVGVVYYEYVEVNLCELFWFEVDDMVWYGEVLI